MADLRRARLAINKYKTNAWTNKRGDTANKIVVRWLPFAACVLLNITRSVLRRTEEHEWRNEVIREDGDRCSDQKRKLIDGYLLNWTARVRNARKRISICSLSRPFNCKHQYNVLFASHPLFASVPSSTLFSLEMQNIHNFFSLMPLRSAVKRAVRKFNGLIWPDQTFVHSFGVTVEKRLIFWF